MTDDFDHGQTTTEQIKELRDMSDKMIGNLPRFLTTAVLISGPYLLIKFASLVGVSPFPNDFVIATMYATILAVGVLLIFALLTVFLFAACRCIVWWDNRRYERMVGVREDRNR